MSGEKGEGNEDDEEEEDEEDDEEEEDEEDDDDEKEEADVTGQFPASFQRRKASSSRFAAATAR
jgi:hypothetical protein